MGHQIAVRCVQGGGGARPMQSNAKRPFKLPKQTRYAKGQDLWNSTKKLLKDDPLALIRKLGYLKIQAIRVANRSRLAWAQFQQRVLPKKSSGCLPLIPGSHRTLIMGYKSLSYKRQYWNFGKNNRV